MGGSCVVRFAGSSAEHGRALIWASHFFCSPANSEELSWAGPGHRPVGIFLQAAQDVCGGGPLAGVGRAAGLNQCSHALRCAGVGQGWHASAARLCFPQAGCKLRQG